MAHCTVAGTEQELTYFNLTDEDEGYLRLPTLESTRLEEEYICLPSHGGKKKEVEEGEMDEEQQVLCEGSFEQLSGVECLLWAVHILIISFSPGSLFLL